MSTAGAFFPATRVTGVDGCRDGWVGVDLDDGGSVTVRTAASLDELLAGTEAQQVVGVDMPLGLLASGWRAADRGARALLGPRRSSIFAIPPAPVWQAPTYAAEYRLLCPHPLCEVHPELSFRMMAGAPLQHPKHAAAGHAQRRALLAGEGIVMPGDEALGRIAVDVLDAAAAAWSARRIAAGHACVLPDPPQTDPTGRDVAIRY
jgi:predicted RNase H-like nuclease